jgi:hypothetical protein
MLKPLIHNYKVNLDYAHQLIADVGPDKWTCQPAPKTNHAAWVIGHLAITCDFTGSVLGLKGVVPKEWEKLFSSDSVPQSDAKLYPGKETVWAALKDGHERTAAALLNLATADWEKPFPIENMRTFVPTLGDGLVFLFIAHENFHLGQLSAWRRVLGLPSV